MAQVCLFLAGMMLLAELARQEGLFEWLAEHAVRAAKGSASRLLLLVCGAGILITVFLSNDATVVVLTPAVYAAVRKARANALPYLFACAFIANAASFVLPISNPANLVVFGKNLPPLFAWLKIFLLPSIAAILATCAVLYLHSASALRQPIGDRVEVSSLPPSARRAAWGVAFACAVFVVSSTMGLNLGIPGTIAGAIALLVSGKRMKIFKGVSWSVIPLVAGLFLLVEALDRAGVLSLAQHALRSFAAMPRIPGALAAAFGVGLLSNVLNNLPSGLLTGTALQAAGAPAHIRSALLIGIDLSPNLSITGSLATILWLIAIRREGENVTALQFLKVGAIVMPPALALAVLLLLQ